METEELTGAMARYLKTIVEIEQEGQKVRAIDIARRNGVKKPSVCNAIDRLKALGYLTADGGRNIALTEEGRKIGNLAVEREQFFAGLLERAGFSPEEAKEEAASFSPYVSGKAFLALKKVLGKEA